MTNATHLIHNEMSAKVVCVGEVGTIFHRHGVAVAANEHLARRRGGPVLDATAARLGIVIFLLDHCKVDDNRNDDGEHNHAEENEKQDALLEEVNESVDCL